MKCYQIPASAFVPYCGISVVPHQTICSLEIAAESLARNFLIWGTIEASALSKYAIPLSIDVDVRIGDPVTGELIARGIGSTQRGMVSAKVVPLTPASVIPADTPSALYVNLVFDNNSLPLVCDFNVANSNSGLFVIELDASDGLRPEYEKVLTR
jgi:hypothetical protein